ncbi:MAG: hypothetical protein WD709_00690, partial [Gammaproteobacteria bacterium]
MNHIRLYQILLVLPGVFLLITGVMAQSYEQGRAAYIQGDYQAAYDILRPLAESGDAEAQKMLGIMYDYGHGVSADAQQALDWYIRAAEQGQVNVQYQVGTKYFKGGAIPRNYSEAARWWQLAADNGQVDAQFNLGLMYFRGMGIEQDDAKAAELFLKAANQDHGHAQYSVAVMYAFGRGFEQDYDTAFEWFNRAAGKDIAQAQYNLGIFYENGYSVEQDLAQAEAWYQRAAAQGLDEAKTRLERLASLETVETASAGSDNMASGPASSPGAGYQLSEITTNNIKRESWVLQQRADTYTIQIGSITREDDLVDFIKSHGLEDNSAYIEIVIDGVTRYNGFYGVYESYAEAETALA